jgi:hypothetical protein
MVRMVALKPWFNRDEEGSVAAGTFFEARESRARELSRAGLATPAIGDGSKIRVPADVPAEGPPPKRKRAGRKAIVQLAAGPEYVRMLDLTADIHARYCSAWGAEFIAYREARPKKARRPPHWRKVEVIRKALDDGFEQVLWLDADSVIVDAAIDLFAVCRWGIGLCECWDSPKEPPHLNTGVVWLNACSDVLALVEAWNAMPSGMQWEDQGALIALMQKRRWRSLLTVLPNRYNWVQEHMEAADPVIRSFHGEPHRLNRMEALLLQGTEAAA